MRYSRLNGLGVSLRLCNDVGLISKLDMNDGGKESTGLTIHLHRNRPGSDDTSTFTLSDTRAVSSCLKKRLFQ